MNLRNFEIEEKLFIRRAITAFVLVAVCFGILVYNLYRLQICEHSYYQTRSNDNDIKMIPIAPTRGDYLRSQWHGAGTQYHSV